MTFPERVVYQQALQMYKTIHCDALDYLTTSFTFTSDLHSRLLRSSSTYHLYTHRPRHEIFRHSFTFSGASVWNPLPVNIQNAVKPFKSLYLRWFRFDFVHVYLAFAANHIAMFYGTVYFILHWPLIWYLDPNTHL